MAYYTQQGAPQQGHYPAQQGPYPPTQTVYYATAAPVAPAYQQPAIVGYRPYFPRTTSTVLGALQIMLAIVSVAAAITAVCYEASLYEIGVGFWCGIFYFIAGVVAIAAGQHPTNQLISATALCSGFDIAFGITQLTIASVGVSNDVYCLEYECVTWKSEAVAANCLMIGVGSWQVIFGCWLFAVSCRAIYSGSHTPTAPVPVTYATTQPEAVYLQGPPPSQGMPPQGYYVQQQQQYPSSSNPQQMMYAGGQQQPQAPPMMVKPGNQPPNY
jgi:hypothetical protein